MLCTQELHNNTSRRPSTCSARFLAEQIAQIQPYISKSNVDATTRTMTPRTMAPRKTLAEHVQDLPADLYYIIFDYTLTLDGHMGIQHYAMITKKWKPPAQLQINRATRAKVAEKFYHDSFFTIRSGVYHDLLSLFFGRLSEEHASMITRVGLANMHSVPREKQADYIRMCIWRGRDPQIRREMWDKLEEIERIREEARRNRFW